MLELACTCNDMIATPVAHVKPVQSSPGRWNRPKSLLTTGRCGVSASSRSGACTLQQQRASGMRLHALQLLHHRGWNPMGDASEGRRLTRNLFRWASQGSFGDELEPSLVTTRDYRRDGIAPVLDTHDPRIATAIGVPGELRSLEQAGMCLHLAGHVDAVLDRVEDAVLTSGGTSEWRRNRWHISELALRFLSAARTRPGFVFAHRSCWTNATVVRGCFGGDVRTLETETESVVGDAQTKLFGSSWRMAVQPSSFAWHLPEHTGGPPRLFFHQSQQEGVRHASGRRSTLLHSTLGIGHRSEIVRLESSGAFAQPSLEGVRALWVTDGWTPFVAPVDAHVAGHSLIGFVSRAQCVRFIRLHRTASGTNQDELLFQVHPESGGLLHIKANSGPFSEMYGVNLEDTSMGEHARSL